MFNLPKQTMHSSHKIVKSANACEGAEKNRQQQISLLFFWESKLWINAILLQLQLDTSRLCIWQRWKWEVCDKYFWRLGEPWQRPRQFHKTWAVALKAVRLITIMTSADFENVDLKLVFTHKESLRRKLWKMGGLRSWSASTTSSSTQRSSFKGLYRQKSFWFCFCFQKSLNSEFEGLSKLVCVDVVVALVFKATEVRQWALLCNILFNSRFLFFESNNYFASALCTDAVGEEM